MRFHIKPEDARIDDYIIELHKRRFGVMEPWPQIQSLETPSGGVAFAYGRNGRPRGLLVAYTSYPYRSYTIELIYVDENCRRQGIATELYKTAVAQLGPLRHSTELTLDGIDWIKSLARIEADARLG